MSVDAEYRELLAKYVPRPIRSERDYQQALAQLEELMDLRPSKASSLLIELLSTLIEKYESRQHPMSKMSDFTGDLF